MSAFQTEDQLPYERLAYLKSLADVQAIEIKQLKEERDYLRSRVTDADIRSIKFDQDQPIVFANTATKHFTRIAHVDAKYSANKMAWEIYGEYEDTDLLTGAEAVRFSYYVDDMSLHDARNTRYILERLHEQVIRWLHKKLKKD